MQSEVVRNLKPQELEIIKRRLREVADAAEAHRRANRTWEDLLTAFTAGDPQLGIDVKAGTIVRKAD